MKIYHENVGENDIEKKTITEKTICFASNSKLYVLLRLYDSVGTFHVINLKE